MVDDFKIDLRKSKPTAKFVGIDKSRTVEVRAGEAARLPLQLVFIAWAVWFTRPEKPR